MIFCQFISDINNSKRETLLNLSNNEKEKEFSDQIAKDFLNKKIIDLSFIDSNANDPEENYINQKYSNIPVINSNNQQLYNENLIRNYYYYQQLARMNNLMHNYQQNNNNNNRTYNKNNQVNSKIKSIDRSCLINISDIKDNKEKRTTVRMMNIPSYFTPLDLSKKLDEKFGISPQKENRVYDFTPAFRRGVYDQRRD